MKTVLVSLNAKFIHSSLALRYIKDYCSYDIETIEFTINHEENLIIKTIYNASPDILGFSCYIWNIKYIKSLIPILKKIMPNIKIVLGGPEVSFESRNLLNELPIDIIMEGEGEQTWQEYLDYIHEKRVDIKNIDGLVYKQNKQIVVNDARQPLKMALLPFVYKNMDGLENKIIYYEASRGCPFNCQYCISSLEKQVRFLPIERVKRELQHFLDMNVAQVKFIDRTFNAKKDFALEIWMYIVQNDNGITNFHFEIAAELLTKSTLEVLSGARKGLIQFEIGVQSTNIDTLIAIKRFMPFEKISIITKKIASLGNIHQHLDLIAGLPYEGYSSFKKSFNDVISVRPEQLQLGFLKVLKGSGLYFDGDKYGIVYKEEAPYEVLYTKNISYKEILKLHLIEEMLEKYYNSRRFNASIEYLFSLFNTPFDFFEELGEYWECNKYDEISHKKLTYYKYLLEFAQNISNCNIDYLKELLRWDMLSHENVKEIPSIYTTLDQVPYKNEIINKLKDPQWAIQFGEEFVQKISKQKFRSIHIEFFKYNMFKEEILLNPQGIIFDYTYGNNMIKTYYIKEN
ncbi:hypothetical protein AN639_10625 [Candidatus Epulonipiscium fishelsonii]|uniref:Uncharacterized protein n=1 Tax=Candidatus Epulonipiscium fishelsonii TaxID=77094 RepID=A0ACC8X9M8_9FIRM|nr:hypothetical protein AN396_09435 [Epulopiscium sp. SCG-B11WGA-EpuloA1]ONI43344.1 hypothetical protein AN639_10625 [Epulopiscium sp. SCG-B05WGA-EpuloA1]